MSWSDLDLLALGPGLAVMAGLFIVLTATLGQTNRGRNAIGAGEGQDHGEGR